MPYDTYVLVVDDDPPSRQLMVDLIELIGIPVETAATGHEALLHIRRKVPGFVIVDLLMPGMHGLTLLSRLKLDLELHRIPTLVLTGAPLSNAEISKLSSSVLGVVRKGDISMQDIAYVIEETLEAAATYEASVITPIIRPNPSTPATSSSATT